jgi:alanine racemase
MYGKGPDDNKHKSPVKRLVTLKGTTVDHKSVMDKKGARYGESYKLTYCSSP